MHQINDGTDTKKQHFKFILPATCTAFIVGISIFTYVMGHDQPQVDPKWEMTPSLPSNKQTNSLTVRYTGTSTLLFSDGKTSWMTDGSFSRPGLLQMYFGKIAPDLDAIELGLKLNGVTTLAVVFPLHSHYDHSMDAPEVAKRTGAILMGSETTANIARGWGLPESSIKVVNHLEKIQLGEFTLTPIVSQHFQFPNKVLRSKLLDHPETTEPLATPTSVFNYKLGKAYILHVEHPKGSFLIIGSAGFIKGQLSGMKVDTVFLGIGGLSTQSADYQDQYWAETIEQVTPQTVIPIHWDSLTSPISEPFLGQIRVKNLISIGTRPTLELLKEKERGQPTITFKTLPRFNEVVLFP